VSGTRLFRGEPSPGKSKNDTCHFRDTSALTWTRICPTRIFHELHSYIKKRDAAGVTDEAKAESHTLKRVFRSGIANYYLSHFVKLKTQRVLDLTIAAPAFEGPGPRGLERLGLRGLERLCTAVRAITRRA